MDFDIITSQYPIVLTVLTVLGTLSVLGSVYVKISPSTEDDTKLALIEAHPIFGYILRVLRGFSLIKPKNGSPQ